MQKIWEGFSSILFFIKHYAFWLVLHFLFISGTYIVFREFYYFGTLNLYISENNTMLVIDGKGEYECPETFCSIELFPKKYTILIKKEGFTPVIKTIDIHFHEIREENIYIKQSKSALQWIKKTKNDYNKGISFPFSKSYIDKNIENFTIVENTLLYKKNKILSFPNTFFVSTDEVGRNVWIVSKDDISQFSLQQKNFFPILKEQIKRFYPQKDGFFSWENKENKKFYFNGKKNIPLEIDTFSLFTACKLPSTSHENIWAYLSYNEGTIALYIRNIEKPYERFKPRVFLENISANEIDYIECNAKNSIKGMLKSGKLFQLTF